MLNLEPTHEDVPGMAWCSRIMEKLHPERNIPEKKTLTSRFANEKDMHRRIDALGQLVTVAQDLKLTDEELLNGAITVESVTRSRRSERRRGATRVCRRDIA